MGETALSDPRFKIVSAGWRCAQWWEQTLRSVEEQTVENYDVQVMYDGGDDAGAAIQQWCDDRDDRWQCHVNDRQQFVVRNQVDAIRRLAPDDDDVIVFLDLDGDRFAHRDVLARLGEHYRDDTLVTFGSFRPVPAGPWAQAQPFPPDVVAAGAYRQHTLTVSQCWNHLRTMKGRVCNAIPPDQFVWPDGPHRGQMYETGADYIFMTAALDLAGRRHKFVPEILLLYNNANPFADNLAHPQMSAACTQSYLHRPPLTPLPGHPVPPTPPEVRAMTPEPFLPPAQRRRILSEYGHRYQLRVFVETGTADGDTPAALAGQFDRLFTIEVGLELHAAAWRRFQGTNVVCYHGDSAEWLPQLVDMLEEPALFWLDGHFCGGDRGSKDTPVIEELEAIFASSQPHVILVDDARLFEGMSHYGEHDWPHVDELRNLADKHGYRFVVADDIIRLTPA